MSAGTQTFTKPKSLALIARITELARECGRITVADVRAATGLCDRSARGYLNRMTATGAIHCSFSASRRIQHAKPSEWALGGEVAIAPDDVSDNDDFPRRVVVRSSWTPNHARMAMECLLFGVPAVLQGAAA